MTRSPFPVLALFCLALLATGCQSSQSQPSLLFVQVANTARVMPIDGSDDSFSLELDGVGSTVTYFSDRPYRMTGSMPTKTFVERWNDGADSFEDDPPNAAVSIGESEEIMVVELTDPVQEGSTVRYTIRVLEDSPHFRQPDSLTMELGPTAEHVVLFIDNLTYHGGPSGNPRSDPMNRGDNFGRGGKRFQ